jgi:ubiquinone/menaquinone biosynthesis C-methylase UbiE
MSAPISSAASASADPAARPNWSLGEEVRAYWSERAATFDDQAGHRITSGPEAAAWQALLAAAIGGSRLTGLQVLDLACGTGEVSRVALDMGARVTGVDFSDPMLERAQAKHAGRDWVGLADDVQSLAGLPDAGFDAAVARHLVWTLTDPQAAFGAWLRVLRPGGRLVIVDGNWAHEPLRGRLLRALADRLSPRDRARASDTEQHRTILAQLPYRDGLTFARLRADLADAGFVTVSALSVRSVYGLGMRRLPLADWLRLNAPVRFGLVAERRVAGSTSPGKLAQASS